jgi:hypothetical protein
VINWYGDLLRFQAELVRDYLHGVDRGTVETGLAGLAKSSVVNRNTEAVEQAFQGGGAAIECRGLDHLGGKESASGHEVTGRRRGPRQSEITARRER